MTPSTDAEDLVESFRAPHPAREQKCRSCGAPVDFRPTAAGKVGIYDRGTDVSHFTTCPQAQAWRQKPTASPAPQQPRVAHDVHTRCRDCRADVLVVSPWGRAIVVELDERRWVYVGGEGDPRHVVSRAGIARNLRLAPAGFAGQVVEGRAVHPHQPERA